MASTDEMNANFDRFIYCNIFFSLLVPYIIYYYRSITLFITLYLPTFSACSFVPYICLSFCTIYIILPTSKTLTAIVYYNSNLEPLFSLY